MKSRLTDLVKWFCRRLTYNDLASVIVVLHDVLSGSREDIRLKPEEKPPHYRDFRVDTTPPLETPPERTPEKVSEDWRRLLRDHEKSHGRKLSPVRRRKGSAAPPSGCGCEHCNAPRKYLCMNNGKRASQVLCKVCGETSPTHRVRRESEAKYWRPHCGKPMTLWKTGKVCNIFKCFSYNCPEYLRKRTVIGLENLDPESTGYRRFKQLVERLNRTCKYHTRPRAGFKTFEGAVALTTLFVAYYNFMRPHSARNAKPPVSLQCPENVDLMPQAWIALIREAA